MADVVGRTVGDELERIGYARTDTVGGFLVESFFKIHIEQVERFIIHRLSAEVATCEAIYAFGRPTEHPADD